MMILTGRISLAALAVLLTACTEQVEPRNKNALAEIEQWSQSFPDRPQPIAEKKTGPMVMARERGPAWDWSDPCVENLHELTGLFLLYYRKYHELPESLSALDLKGLGGEAKLNCPASMKNYVYTKEGLVPPLDFVPVPERARGGDRLILYDAQPAHDIVQKLTDGVKDWDLKKTIRYGIVMKPIGADRALQLQVVPVEQALLDAYIKETRDRSSNLRLIRPFQGVQEQVPGGQGGQVAPPGGAPAGPLQRPNTGGLW